MPRKGLPGQRPPEKTPTIDRLTVELDTPAWRRALGSWLAGDAATLVALLVILLYGVTRPAYASFLGALGMTPEDIELSQSLILFRTALHVAREAATLSGLAVAFWATRTLLLSSKLPGPLRSRQGSSPWYRLPANYVAAVPVLVLFLASWYAVDPPDREPAAIGLVACALLMVVIAGFLLRDSQPWLAYAAVAVVMGAGVSYGAYQNAAASTGWAFLHEGRVSNAFRLVLNVRANYVQPMLMGKSDPDHLCGIPAYYQLLGSSDGTDYVLVRPTPPSHLHEREFPPYVARLNEADYRLRLAVLQTPRASRTGSWPGPPVACA
jgi:hypothetical protein